MLPPMPSDNALARISVQVGDLWKLVNEMRSSMGVFENATIGKGGLIIRDGGSIGVAGGGAVNINDGGNVNVYGGGAVDVFDQATGARMIHGQGSIAMWDNFNTNPDGFGQIYCDPGAGINYFRFYPPYTSGDGRQNSFTIQGRTPDAPGNIWAFTDGDFTVVAGARAYLEAANWNILTGGELGLYELPTTGSAANLTLGFVGDTWTVAMSTSSERYKTDIAPVEVDPAEVLELTGITWVHNDAMDRSPVGDIARNVGWHAEQIDSKPSLRQFVNYDEQGRPDSVEDSRMTVALLELCKAQQTQIDALTDRLDALEGTTTPRSS